MYRRRSRVKRDPQVIAAEKAERASKSLTCQVCGRLIMANTGVIAHHGYERPGHYQTESCMGARHLPYEADRLVLKRYIDGVANTVKGILERIVDVEAEKCPIAIYYVKPEDEMLRHPLKHRLEFTRETLLHVKADFPRVFRWSRDNDFDHFKRVEIEKLKIDLAFFKNELKSQQKRYAAWKRTVKPVYIEGRFDDWGAP